MKKSFLLMLLSLAILTACNNEKKEEGDKKSEDTKISNDKMGSAAEEKEERNKKTALASLDGVNAHSVDQTLKDAAADCTDYNDGTQPATKGMDNLRAGLGGWFTAFPDVKCTNLKAVADGDMVMVWGDWSGTWKGDFMGQKASGKPYKMSDVDIFKFNDEGKVTEHRTVQYWATAASQVGMKMN